MKSIITGRSFVHSFTFIAVCIILTASHATAQSTYTWAGTASGDWGNASNWDTSPVFAAGNEFEFYSTGALNLTTFMGSSARIIGGLTFNSNADSEVIIRTYSTASGTGGGNKILTFDNGTEPVYITVEEGAEGDIKVAPGAGRTVLKSDMIITHNGTGLLTYHYNNWIDDEGQGRYVIKKGPGSLLFGASGWKLGGGLVVREGRVKILRDDAFGTGTLTMTGGGLSANGGSLRTFTNSYFLSNNLIMSDATDTGLLLFSPEAKGVLVSNTLLNVKGNGLIFQGELSDEGLNRSLTKTGSGALALTAANTYGGGTTLEEGRIRIGNNEAFGAGDLRVKGGTLSSNSGGPRIMTNNYYFSGDITLGHSTDNGALTLQSDGILESNTTLNVVSGSTLYNAIGQSGGDRSLTKTGPANLTLSLTQVNTFAGGLNIMEGTLIVNNSQDRLGSGAVTLDGGTLRYIGSTVHATINRDLMIGDAGGTLELNTNDRVITWAKPITGSGTLTKKGTGTLALNVANTHTGEIVVANGLLQIDGAHPGTGNITVQNGGSIGGSSSAAGTCIVESGGMLNPGSGSIGTFTLGELELQEGAAYHWELDSSSSDIVNVNGDISLPTSFAIEVDQITPTTIKNRVLFTYSGIYSGPERANLTATGDIDTEANYQTLHDSQNKQILLVREPDGTIIYIL